MSTPVIRLSDSARRVLREAAVDTGGPLRIRISERFDYDLFLGSRAEDDVEVNCGGIKLLLDPLSAQRAEGLSIDFLSGPEGSGFEIEHPNAPARVKQISAAELKAMMDRAVPFELVDVRTEEERAISKIEGSRLLNEEGHAYLLTLDRNTTIVFHCHHGIRSQAAAEYFLREAGFRNLYTTYVVASTPGQRSWIRPCPGIEVRWGGKRRDRRTARSIGRVIIPTASVPERPSIPCPADTHHRSRRARVRWPDPSVRACRPSPPRPDRWTGLRH